MVVCEACKAWHVNGDGFERREFQCGFVASWSPNFRREEITVRCPTDPEQIKIVKKMLVSDLEDRIRWSDAPKEFKEEIRSAIRACPDVRSLS